MPSKTQSILLGGVVAAVAATILSVLNIPYLSSCIGCLIYILAGLIAVWHYTETHRLTIAAGTGAGLGAGAGAVAGLIGALLSFLLQAMGLLPNPSEAFDQAMSSNQAAGGQMETVQNFFNSPYYYVVMIAVLIIVGAILGAIGGAIGASVFKRGGDTPGDGATGGGPGGPREPAGDRPSPGGPVEQAPPPAEETETREREAEAYRPAPHEEEAAPRQG